MALVSQVTVAALLSWFITSSLCIYPHSLSYFNESVGGPLNGSQHLLGSNVDWGQDLLYLHAWAGKHNQKTPINVAYFGAFRPRTAGIEFNATWDSQASDVLASSRHTLRAISVNFAAGYRATRRATTNRVFDEIELSRLLRTKPKTLVTYSYLVYRVVANSFPGDPHESAAN